MRRRGTLVKWDDAKGFGFISPDDRSDDVFLHRNAIVAGARRPALGAIVTYELTYDAKRRRRAAAAEIERSFGWFGASLAIAVPGSVLGGGVVAARHGWIPDWVSLLYIVASGATAIAYALDKHRAQTARWRISEGNLHLFEFAGGWPGAFAAQRFLRHKTRKLSFQVTYWLIVVAHLAFWSWFAATKLGWLRP